MIVVSKTASAGMFSRITSANLRRCLLRSKASKLDQIGKAELAALTAFCTSSAAESGTVVKRVPVAGFITMI